MEARLTAWISKVQCRFRDGPPNGWLEGWDAQRHAAAIEALGKPGEFRNMTSFDYSFCNNYTINVPNCSALARATLTIQLSFVVDTFVLFWNLHKRPSRQGFARELFECQEPMTERVRDYLTGQGFQECPDEWIGVPVHGIELVLSGTENVTLGKCLFWDHEG